MVSDPIDPSYLSEVPFGTSSFWIQPWRAYLDTWPASRLLEAVGINFQVHTPEAQATAQLLQDSGFKLARIGINWSAISYTDPSVFLNEADIRARLIALRDHGLRPLILLDANSVDPGPEQPVGLETLAPAPAGAQTVTLTSASAEQVVPGKTGFDKLTFGGDPDVLITAIHEGDVATLSRPLPQPLAAGEHQGATLLYAPFGPPQLSNGKPNPAYQTTLGGWLNYVSVVCKEATSIFGPEGYDLEVWNELTFGSQFLNSGSYYAGGEAPTQTEAGLGEEGSATEVEYGSSAEEPAQEEALVEGSTQEAQPATQAQVTKSVAKALLDDTVAFVRSLGSGIGAGVGITDGFASQTPFPSGANAPLGLTALSKHPYANLKRFPSDARSSHMAVVNALGEREGGGTGIAPFLPGYDSLFPESTLTATNPGTLIRDLAPFTSFVYGFPHGREIGPEGGDPVQKWITEYNLNSAKATPMGPDEASPATGGSAQVTPADREHFQAKALLRSLVANVSKGVTREYFFKAGQGPLDLISNSFFEALRAAPNAYPGEEAGGETMSGFHNMLAQFQGPGPQDTPRQLQLLSIEQEGDHAQFTGDGTAAHPRLYDDEVLAIFPFQSSPTRFVLPVYVMTRDLLTLYEPNMPVSDIRRFDLPDETFRITLGDLPEGGPNPSVRVYDPLRNQSTPAHLLSREGSTAVVELAATDYPRLLTIEYGPS